MNYLKDLDVTEKAENLESNANGSTGIAEPQKISSTDTNGKKPAENDKLVKVVKFVMQKIEIMHDKDQAAFATINTNGQTMRLDSSAFSHWLSSELMAELGLIPRESLKREAIQTLTSLAVCRGPQVQIWKRCGVTTDGAYVVDLCHPENSLAVVISAGNWQLVQRPPIVFARTSSAMHLPIPQRGGDIENLWSVVNVPEGSRDLVLAWLLDAFRPDTPFPVLEFVGEEGCSKSTTQANLRKLIDPNLANLRTAPRNRHDVCISAGANWLVSYENLSHLPNDVQDVLCSVSTGGGFSTRKLFNNDDEHLLKFKNPIMLNGISAVITQQDLLSRAISIEMPRIVNRLEESVAEEIFNRHHSSVLGGIFDLLAASLAELPNVKIAARDLPRMADFCKLGMAMYLAMGKTPDAFRQLYAEMHMDSIRRTIDSHPVACAIQALLENEPLGMIAPPAKILEHLEKFKPPRCDGWPQSGKGMGDALRRLSPAMSKIGVVIQRREDLSRRKGTPWEIRPDSNVD